MRPYLSAFIVLVSATPAISECPITRADARVGVRVDYQDSPSRVSVLQSDGVVVEYIYFAGEPGDSESYVEFSSYYGILPIEMIEYSNGEPIESTRLSFEYLSDIPTIEQLLETNSLEL